MGTGNGGREGEATARTANGIAEGDKVRAGKRSGTGDIRGGFAFDRKKSGRGTTPFDEGKVVGSRDAAGTGLEEGGGNYAIRTEAREAEGDDFGARECAPGQNISGTSPSNP